MVHRDESRLTEAEEYMDEVMKVRFHLFSLIYPTFWPLGYPEVGLVSPLDILSDLRGEHLSFDQSVEQLWSRMYTEE